MANKSRRILPFARICLIVVVLIAPNPTLFAQATTPPATGGAAAQNRPDGLSPGRLLGDLGRNSVALVSESNIAPLFLGAGGALAAHAADDRVRDYFSATSRLGPLEPAGDQLGRFLVVAGTVGALMVVGERQGNEKFRRFTYDLGQATAISGLMTGGLKLAARRPRPDGPSHASFPSGHTASAFTVATVVTHYYGPKAAIPGYLAATLVGLSRLDADRHYLSDVVAGAAIGYIVGRTVTRRSDREDGPLAWTPVFSRASRTVAIGVTWRVGQ